jgi:hypothetical protein
MSFASHASKIINIYIKESVYQQLEQAVLWNPFNEDSGTPGFKIWRIIRIAVFVIIGLIIFFVASSQSLNLFMNVIEFGNVFTKPLFYSMVSGLILCSVAVIRVDFRHRNSLTWS